MSEVKNCGMSVTEAIENLTLGETEAIEAHYGKGLDKFSGTNLTAGLVWAFERRNDLKNNAPKLTSWDDVKNWTMKQVDGYFEAEEVEIDPADPETEQGKGDSLAA